MSYWGNGPIDNDYAFNKVGGYVIILKERMFKDANSVVENAYAEQSIVASVRCIRLLAREFPKCVILHFGTNELAMAKELFDKWFESVKKRLPAKYREAIRSSADAEFELFEKEVLSPLQRPADGVKHSK
jgi:hypothetical protein